jgi:hypothetical protein
MATTRVEQGVTWGNLSRCVGWGMPVWKGGYKRFDAGGGVECVPGRRDKGLGVENRR